MHRRVIGSARACASVRNSWAEACARRREVKFGRLELGLRPGIPPTSGPRESNGFFAPATEQFESELQVTVAIEGWPDLVVRTKVQVPSATSSAEGPGWDR